MQTPEQFMAEYFSARTAEIRKQLEARLPFREKYFAEDCLWDNKSGVTQDSESEMIVSVTALLNRVEVVTQTNFSEDAPEIETPMSCLKYILHPRGDSWVIEAVEMKCVACHVFVPEKCDFCDGTGWIRDIDLDKFRSNSGERPSPPQPPWRNRF
jgi:hypothetical protein